MYLHMSAIAATTLSWAPEVTVLSWLTLVLAAMLLALGLLRSPSGKERRAPLKVWMAAMAITLGWASLFFGSSPPPVPAVWAGPVALLGLGVVTIRHRRAHLSRNEASNGM